MRNIADIEYFEAAREAILIEDWWIRPYKDGIILCGNAINHPKRPEKPVWCMTTSRVMEKPEGRTLRQGDIVRTRGSTYLLGARLGFDAEPDLDDPYWV